MIAYYAELVDAYPIVSIEDPLDEEDWEGWQAMTAALGEQAAARRRRPLRHQRRAARARHHRAVRQRAAGEGQPDRLAHRDPRLRRPRAPQRLPLHDEPPLGRDRGHHDRRPGGRDELRPDQDRRAGAVGAGREVQPAAAHRGGARRRGPVRRARRLPALHAPDPTASTRGSHRTMAGQRPTSRGSRPGAPGSDARPAAARVPGFGPAHRGRGLGGCRRRAAAATAHRPRRRSWCWCWPC